ncbi:hypothetical protein JQN58_17920 [Aneurinibacillus sp. BA2021]|nr:hypothetical protein [Aneurinibacillus sp. BA2021]
MKRKNIYVILLLFVLALVALISSTRGYNYVLEGSSQNWTGRMEIKPANDKFFTDMGVNTIYVGALKKRNNKEVINLQYEAFITLTNQKSGKIDKPNIKNKNGIQLFISGPPNDRTVFKRGMSSEEIKEIFYNDVVYKITWKDSEGEHTENIILEVK